MSILRTLWFEQSDASKSMGNIHSPKLNHEEVLRPTDEIIAHFIDDREFNEFGGWNEAVSV